jgi:hypothetical protein
MSGPRIWVRPLLRFTSQTRSSSSWSATFEAAPIGPSGAWRTTTSKVSSRRKETCCELPSVRGSESRRSKRGNTPRQLSLPGTETSVTACLKK